MYIHTNSFVIILQNKSQYKRKERKIMIILGIDPGIAIVGWGVIDFTGNKMRPVAYGAITTPAHTPLSSRLKSVHDELCAIIDKYKPDALAAEELFFNTNVKTAINVAHARGVILLCARDKGIEDFEYTPLQVKQALTGYGRADKNQIQNMVKVMLGLNAVPKPDDVADALAVAICHAHSHKLSSKGYI